jgi:hypothetical protein
MEFTVLERLLLFPILPKEGNVFTIKSLRKLREDLSFTEQETKDYNIRQVDEAIVWDNDNVTKEIEISDKLKEVISDVLKTLNEQNKVTEQHLSLFEKFEVEE